MCVMCVVGVVGVLGVVGVVGTIFCFWSSDSAFAIIAAAGSSGRTATAGSVGRTATGKSLLPVSSVVPVVPVVLVSLARPGSILFATTITASSTLLSVPLFGASFFTIMTGVAFMGCACDSTAGPLCLKVMRPLSL